MGSEHAGGVVEAVRDQVTPTDLRDLLRELQWEAPRRIRTRWRA